MPKIKDLGIKFIPETMRPLEQGGGLGCGDGPTIWNQFQMYHVAYPLPHVLPCLCTAITPGWACHPCTKIVSTMLLPTPYPGELTIEQVKTLREQMQTQLNALDEYAKTIGAKTAEEIDAREKALNDELADLKIRRKNLGK